MKDISKRCLRLAGFGFIFITVLLFTNAFVCKAQSVIRIDARRELFVDSLLIEKLNNATLKLNHPRNEGQVFNFDKPWEGNFSAYCTILKDGDLFRAYYRGLREAGNDGKDAEVTCYAESRDGIIWEKSNLHLYEMKGTMDNNVILAHAAPVTHNFSPFIDSNPNVKPEQKYKALGGTKKNGLIAYVSADGIHWIKLQEEPVFTKGLFDSQNVAFWSESEQKYVCYFRIWSGEGYKGFRSVGRTTSDDFIHWTEPEAMTFGDTPMEHLYTQQTSPYYRAPHIYLAIGARFMPNRQVLTEEQALALEVNPDYFKDCSDAFFMTSRGGNKYDRTFMESFIRPGIGLQNWVSRSNYPALNVVQTSPTEISVYVNENYAQPTAFLNRYSLRIDGFVSLAAGYGGGELQTKPFIFQGKELEINYSTSAAGGIKIEIQNEDGEPVPGFTINDCQEIIGNEISRIVTWNGKTDVGSLAGKPVRLYIYLKDADLFSFKFTSKEN
ncbi:glycoside hydrolase family protein [Maribellus maritimus]|uniref:hypothetical protein n=1 Tax=Maribellus maritimus TaxID=2870838 RepID=UPI001EEB0DAE|nr:hypothetical protein [Maribellus maritimus]MCG6188455.1 hypothetical protein [Maribellus maritimus]